MNDTEIATLGRAVAHPLRVRILREMSRRAPRPLSPVEFSRASGEPLGNVSYHLGALRKLGIAEVVATEQRRGALEHLHGLCGPSAAAVQKLLESLG